MRTTALSVALIAALFAPSLVSAQATVEFRIELPVVLPRLVVVSPGVEVVPDVDEEVFFTDGYYWVRRDDRWYRSRSHRSGWVLVGPRYVPARLVKLPPGKYRRYPAAYREERKERREDWREDRKERREEMREDRKEAREREKERRKHGKHGD